MFQITDCLEFCTRQHNEPEFNQEEEMDMIFVETCQACEEIIKDIPFDYFNVLFEPKIIDENGEVQGEKESYRFPRPSLGRAAESGSVDIR